MTSQVLLVQGNSILPEDSFNGRSYEVLANVCGAGRPISLVKGGLGGIWLTYAALVADVNQRLGRTAEGDPAHEAPAILVGHSGAVPLILEYLKTHPNDRAVLLGGPVHGLEYLRPFNAAIGWMTMMWPDELRKATDQLFAVAHDFAPESEFLAQVRRDAHLYADRVVVVAAAHDQVVPWKASRISGANMVLLVDSQEELMHYARPLDPRFVCIKLPGVRHMEHVTNRLMHDLVCGFIAQLQTEAGGRRRHSLGNLRLVRTA